MDIMHVKITFEDAFSGAKTTRTVTRSVATVEKMKESIGQIVVDRFDGHIHWQWKLLSVERAE